MGHGEDMNPRRNLVGYLKAYFSGGADKLPPLIITRRDTDATGGKALTTTFATHLEIASALAELQRVNWLGSATLHLHLRDDLKWREIGKRLAQPYTVVMDEYDRAVDWLVSRVYDWTEGGQALAASAEEERQKAAILRGR